MPWEVTNPMRERERFIVDACSGLFTIAELAERYGVSRKTCYKWLRRHDEEGLDGLRERSRAPLSCPHRTEADLEDAIIAYRTRFPMMGPKKIIARLRELEPHRRWPCPSAAGDLLNRRGLIQPRRRRRRPSPRFPRDRARDPQRPNDVMTIDFKGQFRLGNGQTCYPLTVVDLYSRYILGCVGLGSVQHDPTQSALELIFRAYGLPRAIRCDNGSPFGSPGIGRLSKLSLWWIRLGIALEPIEPGKPQQNGAHERMHKTLKAETARPPASTMRAQQKRFDEFRLRFNEERPHETLGQVRPTTLYSTSTRIYPSKLPELEYPGHFDVRLVDDRGNVKFQGDRIFFSHTFAHEPVAFEEIDDGVWNLWYGPVIVARFHEREMRFYD